MEIDILAVDGDVAVAIEVKSRLAQQDVDDFCEKAAEI
jgi:Holliday junction resolvase-like predicted endonuclease